MQQMAGNMGLLNPFVLNQFSTPSPYSPYTQQYPGLAGVVPSLLPPGPSFLPSALPVSSPGPELPPLLPREGGQPGEQEARQYVEQIMQAQEQVSPFTVYATALAQSCDPTGALAGSAAFPGLQYPGLYSHPSLLSGTSSPPQQILPQLALNPQVLTDYCIAAH